MLKQGLALGECGETLDIITAMIVMRVGVPAESNLSSEDPEEVRAGRKRAGPQKTDICLPECLWAGGNPSPVAGHWLWIAHDL